MKQRIPNRRTVLSGATSLVLGSGIVNSAQGRGKDDPALAELGKALSEQSTGRLVLPGQAEQATIKYYNGRLDCVRSTAYVRPTSAAGVQAFVRWAAANARPFAIRGAGHSFEGKSSHPDLVVDLSLMKGLTLGDDGTLEVEAGVQLGAIYDRLSRDERILPAGTCPTVGVVGHALGGGIGDFLPMYGYAAQSLLEVELVTFKGDRWRVSDTGIVADEPASAAGIDAEALMALLRGAGQGSVGIATGMKFKTHDVSKTEIASFKLGSSGDMPARRAADVIEAWYRWRQDLPAQMHALVSAKLDLGGSGDAYSCEIAGLIAIAPGSSVSVADVRKTLAPLFALLDKKSFSTGLKAAAAIKTFLDDDDTTHNPRRRMLYGASSAFPAALPRRAIEYLLRTMSSSHSVSMYTAGGASKAEPRTSLHPCEFIVEWTTYATRRDPANHDSIRRLRTETVKLAAFKGQNQDFGFPNYPDNQPRDYFANRESLDSLAKSLVPHALSTSSLLLPVDARRENECG